MPEEAYGLEVILDLHGCNPAKFTRHSIEEYCVELCKRINMERAELHFWDYKDQPEDYDAAPDHLKGTSAIQFITTSSITIHTLDVLGKVFINLFSCKKFSPKEMAYSAVEWFGGKIVNSATIKRV